MKTSEMGRTKPTAKIIKKRRLAAKIIKERRLAAKIIELSIKLSIQQRQEEVLQRHIQQRQEELLQVEELTIKLSILERQVGLKEAQIFSNKGTLHAEERLHVQELSIKLSILERQVESITSSCTSASIPCQVPDK